MTVQLAKCMIQNLSPARALAAALTLAIAAAIGVYTLARLPDDQASTQSPVPIGGPFQLIDDTGTPVTDEDFRGRLMLVYFGYTYCPDFCPISLQDLSLAMDQLGDRASEVAFLSISVDPERDTPDHLASYVELFHPRLRGLTGSSEAIAAVAKEYRVYYQRHEDESSAGYLVDHSTLSYLMGRDGRYLTHFNYGTTPETIAEGIGRYL